MTHHRHLILGRYDQHFEELLPFEKTPVDFLRSTYDLADQEARKYLGMFGLDGARHLIRIGELSGGQKARVILASLALQRPHVLVLDEPTNHLDLESVAALVDGLKAFKGGVILVSHDARLVQGIEADLWVCGDGVGVDGVSAKKIGKSGDGGRNGRGGVRVESRGFNYYRDELVRRMEARIKALEAAAEALAEQRRQTRLARLQRATKTAPKGLKEPPEEGQPPTKNVSAVFKKKKKGKGD